MSRVADGLDVFQFVSLAEIAKMWVSSTGTNVLVLTKVNHTVSLPVSELQGGVSVSRMSIDQSDNERLISPSPSFQAVWHSELRPSLFARFLHVLVLGSPLGVVAAIYMGVPNPLSFATSNWLRSSGPVRDGCLSLLLTVAAPSRDAPRGRQGARRLDLRTSRLMGAFGVQAVLPAQLIAKSSWWCSRK